jgi:dipeptidase E
MRLFLASSRPSSGALALSELVGPGARAAIVANALDNLPGFPRGSWVAEERRVLESRGFSTRELDLRCYYADSSPLASTLAHVDLVWVTGGNAFVLRGALHRSGLDTLMIDRIADDALVYGGYSAAACVCAPALRGLELVDDVKAVHSPIWDGLGLIDSRSPLTMAPDTRRPPRSIESLSTSAPTTCRTGRSATEKRSSCATARSASWTCRSPAHSTTHAANQ